MFKFLVVLAVLIRLILMPIAAHSDLFFINMFPNLVKTSGVFDITGHIQENFGMRNYTYYSPVVYFTFAAFQFTYNIASNTFFPWMSQLYNLELNAFEGQAADFIRSSYNPHIYKDLFLAKLPYLIFDVASIFILIKLVKEKFFKKAIVLLWLFNPVNLYSTYLMGQFDIIPVFFTLLGFLSLKKNPKLCLLLLGIAAAFKNYAFIFILPVSIIYGKNWSARLKLLAIGVAPYLITLVPTAISNLEQAIFQILPKVYLHYRKPLEGWALYSQIIKYLILLFSYIFILAIAWTLKVKNKWRFATAISLISILLVYAIAPRISFHYLMWGVPLVILWFKDVRIASYIIAAQAIGLASYKLLANHLQLGLFSPLNPDYFSRLPTLNSIIDKYLPYSIISAVGFFFFMILNLVLIVKILNNLLFKSQIR